MKGKSMKKAALCIALGGCIAALAPMAWAQSATGAIAGRAQSGDQITLVNPATGLTRTVTVNADGSYRLSQLPVGDYQLQVKRGGAGVGTPLSVNVALGGTTTVNLGSQGDLVNLDAIQVVGSRVINRVDVRSTESATTVSRQELARLPVDQSLNAVAMLAPGVISGNASFGGISFGGSSIAENSAFINGLNVTNFYNRHGFSSAPFAFFKEFQVKTGGYSVEFGRSTGGVINAVTRSGSNEFKSGVEFVLEPVAWRAKAKDHEDGTGKLNFLSSRNTRSFTTANVWASGPIVKDRMFFFAMYEQRNTRTQTTENDGSALYRRGSNDGFWGVKLDWNLSDHHLLELLAFSDETDANTDTFDYDFAAGTTGGLRGDRQQVGGGKNGSLTYTGHFGDNFVAKAMYGINRTRDISSSSLDDRCDQIGVDNASYGTQYAAMGRPALGCYPGMNTLARHQDERKATRLDFEWTLGDHLLRFGLDREVMTTNRTSFYPGSGIRYTAYGVTPGALLDNGARIPAGVNAILMGRKRRDGGVFDTVVNAYYLEDIWSITPNLLLNLGLRVDNFDNKTAVGGSFIKITNLVSPRLGFSWDIKGDGSTKLFGNLGRYYLPITNNINYTFAGGLIDERSYYVLDGWRQQNNPVTGNPYMEPIIGAQLGNVDTQQNVSVADLRRSVDRDLDAVYQDEAILGFQSMINQAWSWGVNATYRRMPNTMDDMRINHTPCGPTSTLWPVGNPGKPLTIWGTPAMGCATEGWITIDTSKDGYRKGGSGEVVGYATPRRTYKSMEFQIDRAWDGKWAFNASYLWSKSEGNHEGPVNSDTGYGDTGMVQHWDHPAINQRYGYLFNDRRHQIKLRGSYAFNPQWAVGATLYAQSGGPITAFGVTWPNDTLAAGNFVNESLGGGTGWLCMQGCDGPYDQRVYAFSPRGAFGRMPWTYNLGANVTWTLPVEGIDLKARLSVYNLLNEQQVINVRSRYEGRPGERRATFGNGNRWQSPRYMQLVVTWNF